MMNKALSSVILLLACQVVAIGCSTESHQLWADDLAELTQEQVAIASKTGLQPQQGKPSADAFVMAGNGNVTKQQLTSVLYLQWPQSYGAMFNLLGSPAKRDDWADYYVMPNGHSLTVYYANGVATGYSLGDSGE